MRNHRSTQPHLLSRILWLHITLSERLDAAAIEQWRKRLQDHLSVHGMVAALSQKRIAVLAVGRSITPPERNLVVGWLTEQAEVVFVHIERRVPAPRSMLFRLSLPAHGRSLSLLAPRPVQLKAHQSRPSSRAGPG